MMDEQNFANLFRQTPEMVCILSGPEHRFEFVNEAHIRALGFDATGRTVRDAQPESVEVHGILDEVYRSGETAALREIPVTLTGRLRFFNLTYAARRDASGAIDGIMIMGSEVTDQVLARRTQENHRSWLESVLNRLPSPTLFIDPATARVTFQNHAASQLLGGETDGLPTAQVASGTPLRDHALELRTSDGMHSIEASADLIAEEFGQPRTGVLVLKDVTALKRVQRTLERNEEQLTLALASSKVGFYDWNIGEDSIVFSEQMCADWGLVEPRKMKLSDAIALIHPDDQARAKTAVESAMNARTPYHIEYRVVRPDGSVVWVEVRGIVQYDGAGNATRFFGTSVDITARIENERTLRALADSMPQVVWTAGPDGVLDYTNERWTEYSGSSDPGRWLDFVMPRERDQVVATWTASVASGQPYETKFRLLRRTDHTYRWHLVRASPAFDEAGRVTRWFGTCTDIEDEKRSEDLLRFLADASVVLSGSLDYQTTLANVTRMAVPMIADWASVDMVEADGSIRRLAVSHVDPAKVQLAHELFRRWPPKADDVSGVGQVIRTGKADLFAEITDALLRSTIEDPELLETVHALGLASWMSVPLTVRGKTLGAITFVSAESGRRFGAADLQVAEDLARRAGAAIDNAELYDSAVKARQVADDANRLKDEFLATVSHELRTPLNAMLGWTRMVRTGRLADEQRERALETIERNAVTQAQLIDDLLDVARIISGKLRLDVQSVEVPHLVENAVDALRIASDARKIEVVTALDPAAGQVVGDPHRLGQVLWNLLSNAIKFTDRGGRIHIVAERIDSSLRISVRDTGKGIALEFLPYVFERFKQQDGGTTRAHGGLGLGLAISRHIVELHGGTIAVHSKGEGHGSTFVVDLPLSPVRREARATSSRLASSVGSETLASRPELIGLKVLVVDDEQDARDLVRAILEQCGLIVMTAASVAEAMATIEADPPDLILSDIGMPGEDGYELMRRVRAEPRSRAIPAAALTAYARAEDRRKALDAGFMMHLSKPVEAGELVAVMANLQRFAARAKAT